ncbi:flavin reductase family protein [Brevibacillus sp. GCM10020057]|uniref:flavin reductase family protein n=1 Tax=Brevibacillus sp. GCM10020057 TaxID=3317327 RepID=UPI0036457BB8
MAHVTIQPKILYYGAPVVLLSTENPDGSTNITPLSSSWALGQSVVLGLGVGSQGFANLCERAECVINLPDAGMWRKVEALASLTGLFPVPPYKEQLGFRWEKDKFAAASLTPMKSVSVRPERIAECPLQLEAVVRQIIRSEGEGGFAIVETDVRHVHAEERIVIGDRYVSPRDWNPLIYNFRHYFGLGAELGKTFRSET